jgi:uncharacterized protein YjbJ (UPF0337 family)
MEGFSFLHQSKRTSTEEHLKERSCTMNWDRIEGQWKQRRAKAVHHWGKLMNNELAAIGGKHELLVGMLQEKYGIAKEEAKRQVDEFKKIVEQLKKSNAKLMRSRKSTNKRMKLNRKPVGSKRTSMKRHNQTKVSVRS